MRILRLSLALSLFASISSAEGVLRVLAYDTSPFFYLDNDQPAGLEYEILRYFAEAEGRELQVHFVEDFSQFVPLLERGVGDVAAATLTITAKRLERVSFSESYLPVRVMLVERAGETSPTLESLSGSSVATIQDSVYERLLSDIRGIRFEYAGDQAEMFEWVASGKVQALATDSPIAFQMMGKFDALQLSLPLTEEQQFGFAVSKGSPLADLLSKHIARLKGSGIYFRLLEKYLGADAVEIVQAAKKR